MPNTVTQHCWHNTKQLMSMPPVQVQTCCHCGNERRQTGRASVHKRHRHGPHVHGGFDLEVTELTNQWSEPTGPCVERYEQHQDGGLT